MFVGLVIVLRLFYLQIIKHHYYIKIANSQHWTKNTIPASRGKILVRESLTNGYYPLADNRKVMMVYAVPEEVKDKGLVANELAKIIGSESNKIQSLLENNHTYVIIKRRLEYDVAEKIKNLSLDGIYLTDEEVRYYPEGSLASQVLGYVDNEGKGNYGLEQFFEEELAGVPGMYRAETDPSGKKISFGNNIKVPPKNGTDLVLTINRDVQLQAEKIISETVRKFSAKNGSIIVMNPHNGEIIALANYPNFDPNKYYEVKDYNLFRNIAVSDSYEPGSIFKALTMAAGLNSGKVEPETKYEDKGVVILNGHKIMNSDRKSHGWVNMGYVLEQSLNTGMVFVLEQIGKNVFYDYLKKFNFGSKTEIEQPNESSGRIYAPNDPGVNDHTYATMTFGQSISVTPLQMITSFAVIANGGELVKPHLVSEKHLANGKKEVMFAGKLKRIISQEAAAKLRQMLVGVVERGHGTKAKVKGYKIAGKTGTAQVPKENGKGYDPTRNIGSFIGMGPADDPEFVVLAKVDSPKGVPWAESTAAPAVGQMFDFLFKYYKIPATEPI